MLDILEELGCPHCDEPVHLGDNFLGHEFTCPSCGAEVEITRTVVEEPEETIYSDDHIKITNKRVETKGKNYLLKHVTDVGRLRVNTNSLLSQWLLYLSVASLLGGVATVFIYEIQAGYTLMSLGVLMAAVSVFLSKHPDHYLIITIDGNELKLLGRKDRAYIIGLVGKLKKGLALFRQRH